MSYRLKIPRAEFTGFGQFYEDHISGDIQDRRSGELNNTNLAILIFIGVLLCCILFAFGLPAVNGKIDLRTILLIIIAPPTCAFFLIKAYGNKTKSTILNKMVQFLGWKYRPEKDLGRLMKDIRKSGAIQDTSRIFIRHRFSGQHLGVNFDIKHLELSPHVPFGMWAFPTLLLARSRSYKPDYGLIYSLPMRKTLTGKLSLSRDEYSKLTVSRDLYKYESGGIAHLLG